MSQNPSSSNSERDTDQVNQTTDAQTEGTASKPVSLIEHTEKVETETAPLNKKIPPNKSSNNGKFKLIGLIILILLFGLIAYMVYGKLINLRPLNYKVALKQKQYISALKFQAVLKNFTSLTDNPSKKDRLWFVLLVPS